MTPKQTKKYWREWAAVRRASPTADRHSIHLQALGYDRSSKDLTNREFDRVLAAFWAISKPDSLSSQIRQINQPKQRLLWAIHKLSLQLALFVGNADAYIQQLARDKFGLSNLEDLSAESDSGPSQLEMLRITIASRLQSHRKHRANPLYSTCCAEPTDENAPF